MTITQNAIKIYSLRMFPNLPRFSNQLHRLAKTIRPNVVVGLSDTWFGILAASVAKTSNARLVIDAYDNYEAYMPKARPLHWLWRRALGKADGLTAAGPQLLDLLAQSNPQALRCVVPMAADPLFKPQPARECRQILDLPLERKLIGYLGTADGTRGFDLFQQALGLLQAKRDDFDLVLSGRSSAKTELPQERVHQLGYVADELMPTVLNSCDLLVCVNKDSAFGNYSYPVKIYEALACGRPVLASDTPPAHWILNGDSRLLARLGDPVDLAGKINALLDEPALGATHPGDWEDSARLFASLLEKVCS